MQMRYLSVAYSYSSIKKFIDALTSASICIPWKLSFDFFLWLKEEALFACISYVYILEGSFSCFSVTVNYKTIKLMNFIY